MKFMIIAGEASGDVHGSNLCIELKRVYPDAEFIGTGGPKLANLGQKQYFTADDMAIIGFVEVFKRLPFILDMFKRLEQVVVDEKPDAIILIDYPGFNLRFAKRIKKYNIPVIYFIAPQFWVWHYSRVYQLRDFTDLTLSILPFEHEALQQAGVNAAYIGNPIIDNRKFNYRDKQHFLTANNLSGTKKIIGILPGSRRREIESLLKLLLEASKQYNQEYEFVVSRADNLDENIVNNVLDGYDYPVVVGSQYDIMKYADYIWACSGTVTLECALMQVPTLIVYQSSAFNLWIAKKLSSLRMIGLPNIIMDEKFLPEIVSSDVKAGEIIDAHKYLLSNEEYIKDKLSKLSALFDGYEPCKHAVQEISSFLNSKTL